jgi:hypothetical protein
MCLTIFLSIGYFYLNKSLVTANTEKKNVPYTQQINENTGVLLNLGGEESFYFLDFENKRLSASLTPEEQTENEIYGYPVTFKINADTNLIALIIDYVGGVDLTLENETYRYTGLQVKDLIETTNSKDLRREVIKSICSKISENGIETDFFTKILENSDTDLKFTDCYFWAKEIDTLCQNLWFID